MGFLDLDHRHPLTFYQSLKDTTCFRCELPIKKHNWCYQCTPCSHVIHKTCAELPQTMRHPLHPQHCLTLFPPASLEINTTTICDECHEPCLGNGYIYHCPSCLKFNLHLKCFLIRNLSVKHLHKLTLFKMGFSRGHEVECQTCGLVIDDDYSFACQSCKFFIHFECTFLPPKVKHHHVHDLTFHWNYPEESDLTYCDVCEDRDGKELNRSLSYYYCEKCDYIAHVRCVTTDIDKGTALLKHFMHEHPLIYTRKSWGGKHQCGACKRGVFDFFYRCNECNFVLHKSCAEFPHFIKHPRHEGHILSLQSSANCCRYPDGKLSACNYCHCPLDDDGLCLQCTDCNYAEHLYCAATFMHPLYKHELRFSASSGTNFRCNACGEAGDGYSMSHDNSDIRLYDLHLECFALPGKIDCSFHSHPLYLISSPKRIGLDLPAAFHCDICHAEADPELWVYCCKECYYIAHWKCIAVDLISIIRASNNNPNSCSITQCEKAQFIHPEPKETLCFWLSTGRLTLCYPGFIGESSMCEQFPIRVHNNQLTIQDAVDLGDSFTDALQCPKCEQPIPVQAYSNITDWIGNNPILAHDEPLTLLDEKLVDQLHCPICRQLIFAPTYSCVECQVFYHKSCAELPRKFSYDPGHIFVLLSPSQNDGSLSDCSHCKQPVNGYIYICRGCDVILDVQCALGAPLLRVQNHHHNLFSWPAGLLKQSCRACHNEIVESFCFTCFGPDCRTFFHVECAMLPHEIAHRIHQHPLKLTSDLDTLVDDYVCDFCEKSLNPNLWAYRCSGSCKDYATSHVSCVITSDKKCHFKYNVECQAMSIPEDVIGHNS